MLNNIASGRLLPVERFEIERDKHHNEWPCFARSNLLQLQAMNTRNLRQRECPVSVCSLSALDGDKKMAVMLIAFMKE